MTLSHTTSNIYPEYPIRMMCGMDTSLVPVDSQFISLFIITRETWLCHCPLEHIEFIGAGMC